MKIVTSKNLINTDREVKCPKGGFISRRLLLKCDNMGFSMTETHIPINGVQHWHYKNHLEACYCISGGGVLIDLKTKEKYDIRPGVTYVLDNNDDHTFEAKLDNTVLICVFNPPLTGSEVHQDDGSYKT